MWLVGEYNNGIRVLVDRVPVRVGCFGDVEAAFKRCGFLVRGTTRFALKESDITSEVNPEARVESGFFCFSRKLKQKTTVDN